MPHLNRSQLHFLQACLPTHHLTHPRTLQPPLSPLPLHSLQSPEMSQSSTHLHSTVLVHTNEGYSLSPHYLAIVEAVLLRFLNSLRSSSRSLLPLPLPSSSHSGHYYLLQDTILGCISTAIWLHALFLPS